MKRSAKSVKPRTVAIGVDTTDPKQRYWVVEFLHVDGERQHVAIPFETMARGERAVSELLAKAGYPMSASSQQQREIVNRLTDYPPKKQLPVFSNVGWSGDEFFVPGHLYGQSDRHVPLLGPHLAGHLYAVNGRLKEWQRKVADLARGNSIAMFAISAAFAGPLMHLMNVENGGFMLVGESSLGKSTVAIVAGSVWGGGGRRGFARSCLMTPNASDIVAAAHNETFLVLDESKLGEKEAAKRDNILLELAHRLAGGEEKGRYTDTGPQRQWRVLYLVTSEKTLDQLAKDAGQELSTGQRVRLVDIRADGGAGMGVWQQLHSEDMTPARFSDLIQANAQRYYGSAADAFLRRLVCHRRRDEAGLKEWLTERMNRYLKGMKLQAAGEAEARVATRFALVHAAGCLAARYEVLDWTKEEIRQAVARCHRLMIFDPAGHGSREPEDGVALVRGRLRRRLKDFIEVKPGDRALGAEASSAIGFVHSRNGRSKEFLIEHDRFRDEICGSWPPARVLKELERAGFLNLVEGGKRTVHRSLPSPIGRRRFISIKSEMVQAEPCCSG